MTKFRQAAKNQSCVRCGAADGTVVLAHYFGMRRQSYGGGMGHKGHDAVGAHLCLTCHQLMDTTLRSKELKIDHSEEFLHLCALTWIRLVEQGLVSVKLTGRTL